MASQGVEIILGCFGLNLVGCDLVEVSPPYDTTGNTFLLAANLLGAPYTEAKVGRRVEVVFEKLNDDITLPQFRLAPAATAE